MYYRSVLLLSRLNFTTLNSTSRYLLASCNHHLLLTSQQAQHRFLTQYSPPERPPPGRIRRFFRWITRSPKPVNLPTKPRTPPQTTIQRIKRWLSLSPLIESFLLRSRIIEDEDLARLISKTGAVAIYSLVFVTTLGTFGVDTKPLLAGIGITGFTIGFALKEVATNFISGIFLVINKPFVRGCRIKIHGSGGGIEGLVHFIDVRYVHLKTKDRGIVMIPSSVVYTNAITVFPADDEANAGFLDMTKPPVTDPTKLVTTPTAQNIVDKPVDKKLKMNFDAEPAGSFKKGPLNTKL